jgi:hypothetical protein
MSNRRIVRVSLKLITVIRRAGFRSNARDSKGGQMISRRCETGVFGRKYLVVDSAARSSGVQDVSISRMTAVIVR